MNLTTTVKKVIFWILFVFTLVYTNLTGNHKNINYFSLKKTTQTQRINKKFYEKYLFERKKERDIYI